MCFLLLFESALIFLSKFSGKFYLCECKNNKRRRLSIPFLDIIGFVWKFVWNEKILRGDGIHRVQTNQIFSQRIVNGVSSSVAAMNENDFEVAVESISRQFRRRASYGLHIRWVKVPLRALFSVVVIGTYYLRIVCFWPQATGHRCGLSWFLHGFREVVKHRLHLPTVSFAVVKTEGISKTPSEARYFVVH